MGIPDVHEVNRVKIVQPGDIVSLAKPHPFKICDHISSFLKDIGTYYNTS